jgi:hypothetical protein
MAAMTGALPSQAPAALCMGQRRNIVRSARPPGVSLHRTIPDRRDLPARPPTYLWVREHAPVLRSTRTRYWPRHRELMRRRRAAARAS